MLKKAIATATVVTATALCSSSVLASEALHQAVTAAMGEAIEDPRYLDILAKYGLPVPDFDDELLVNSKDHPYPETVEKGTLLDRVLETEMLRVGWIGVGVPWSVPGEGDDPVGLSVDYWDIIVEKLDAHYGKAIDLDWIEFDTAVGNNDMYKWLATDGDQDCATLESASPEHCYDIIGGAYAINARRKSLSYMTPAYYPLNMTVVRTRTPFNDPEMELNTTEEILAAIADPDAGLILAAYEDTGEHSIAKGWKEEFGDTFTLIFRTPRSNLLEYAETTDAHYVMGTNVRMAVTRLETPDFCSECEFTEKLFMFGGVGFATGLPTEK